MPRRPSIPLTPEDKAAYAKWSCRMLSILAVIVIATLTLPIFRGEPVSRWQARDQAAVRSELPSRSAGHINSHPAVER